MNHWQLIRFLIDQKAFSGAIRKSFWCVIVPAFSLLWVPSVGAEESAECFRIPRPEVRENLSDRQTNDRLLGELIYAGMRTPLSIGAFERWRQNYCCPYICNMVLCHGTCADFAEHCPSFSESSRVIRLDSPGCFSPPAKPTCLNLEQPQEQVPDSISRIHQGCK